MRAHGIQGAKRRGKPWRTTRPDPAARRRPDLVERDFSAEGPDRLWVADFTYLRCWEGVVFFAFVIDAFSRKVVGWQLASHMRTDLVLDALRMALGQREPGADVALVHHTDRGSQYTSADYTQTLDDHGVLASVGSVGDAYDNAMAESFVDTFKTELIADRVWRTRSQLELAVVEYVGWFNHDRLHESLGDIPPAEFEANHAAVDVLLRSPSGLAARTSTPARPTRLRSQRERWNPTNQVPVEPGPAQISRAVGMATHHRHPQPAQAPQAPHRDSSRLKHAKSAHRAKQPPGTARRSPRPLLATLYPTPKRRSSTLRG